MFETVGFIIIFLLVLTVLVVIHEAGHLAVAKAAGVKVLEFGVGFPPRLWGFRRGETLYSVNAIPFGGFVKMVGEEDPSEPRSLAGMRPRTRLLIMAAGPFMNVVLAVVLLTFLAMVPQDVAVGQIVVQEVEHGSPAQAADIQPGDVIVEANGQALDNHSDLIYLVNLKLGTRMTWMVDRGGQRFPVQVIPRSDPPEDQGVVDVLVGNVFINEVQPGSPAQAADIQPGDIIVEVNGQALDNHSHLVYLVNQDLGTSMTWLIQRGDQRLPMQVTPRLNPPPNQGAVGITLSTVNTHVETRADPPWTAGRRGVSRLDEAGVTVTTLNYLFESRSLPPWSAARGAFASAGEVLVLMKNVVTRWLSGGPQPFSGPVGIGQVFVEVGQVEGISVGDRVVLIVRIAAVISLLLGIFNFLPIPALDGGRMFFVAVEMARRGKRIPPQKEGIVHLVGFVILITFMLFITFFVDIQRIIRGESLLGG